MKREDAFYIESLGCAKNQVDSEVMIAVLEAAGWRAADSPEDADVILVNTCGFIADAKKESIETVLSLRARFPSKKIYVAGCLVQRYPEELKAEMPEMDGFMESRDPSQAAVFLEGGRAKTETSFPERRRLLSFPGSAYVKVAEGCDNRCAYCAIPLIKGGLQSRPRESVRAEVRGLLDRGIREIVLVAQDLGSYGADRGARELPALLADLSALKGDFWVRLLYIHPDNFPAEILPLMGEDPRLLPYFDIPFQHASPRILEAMGRRGEPERNLDLIRAIRAALPGAVIRSTFLVGFPGETAEDFDDLMSFQSAAALDWMGAFTFSREEDTPAYTMRGAVTPKTARERKGALEDAQTAITEKALDRFIGRKLFVLIEEPVSGSSMSIGRAYLQAPEVDGLTVVTGGSPAGGAMVRARITRRNGLDLEGEILRDG